MERSSCNLFPIILSSCVISWSPISHPKWTFTVGLCNWPKKKNLHIKRKYVERTGIRSEISWQRGSEDMKTHLLCIAGSCWCPCVAWWSWPAGCWSSWGAPRRSRPSSCQTSRDFAGSEEWKVIEMQVETIEINQTEDFLSPLSLTMCYLDIHPANILLTLFRFHPLPRKYSTQHFPPSPW